VEVPEVRYVITDDDVRIAYQDFGSGPPTVMVPNLFSHLEGLWEVELVRRPFERMGANLRGLLFDSRGAGMSDGFTEPPSLDDRALDIKAVLDAVGIERANVFGFDHGGQVAIGFAARYPHRVDRLVLCNSRVGRSARSQADMHNPGAGAPPNALSAESQSAGADTVGVETNESATYVSPSAAKYPDYLRSMLKLDRLVGTRDAWKRQIESTIDIDVVSVAPLVQAPTLVTHNVGNRLHHVGYARLLAELIPDSTLLEFPGDDHHYWLADNWRDIVDAHIRFITDTDVEAPADRRFAVVLFTDIVGSTSASVASGDDEWRRQLDTHDRISTRVIHRHNGSIVKHTGDGVIATFSTPSHAVDAAIDLSRELAESDIRVRGGLHAGEVEVRGDDISGAVVNLAARVEQAAADGEIYATKTLRDMLIGTSHTFEDAGSYALKGFDGDWLLYRIATA
jgi:class 3 adenylate cyclase